MIPFLSKHHLDSVISHSESFKDSNGLNDNNIDTPVRRKWIRSRTVILLTGLSGAGKTSIAQVLAKALMSYGYETAILDGDEIRKKCCSDLGFSREDRRENLKRVGKLCRDLLNRGKLVICAVISPYAADRRMLRKLIEGDHFENNCLIETHIDCPLHICIQRDTKGLYKKALAKEIKNFTGISAPYEKPEKPDKRIDTSDSSITESVFELISYLKKSKIIHLPSWSGGFRVDSYLPN